ncbi:DNA polymerase III subunit gamma and tau [Microbacterium candidum]|uniref:DNA polymerase III subunit gamma/tau n=1 Tax=Microbacterium candidum TaxID=3041922 RepID=A0ABT7N2S5_9MICO|nr:DNA polymerase III subunit gamma and tau [Microbacterium sp. ASV49]MDL9981009.1 DNA polymerase III subunit gamma and tau [Microbacterium sp. ASV49]
MTTALYRRYRPETFGEMIGQSQVTEPLMTALRGNRVGHAYLFSGPRGCGKTTSARILARCLNCAEGPTDVPCGKCDSCIELGRGGGGSLDVVEIDAASHNGVDDARDLRERAIFAPARDRYKIFILDEAHMVTPQGFNALLKLVEEPPDHVKFIFATTEPEKVIGTIRSRTHHYPFRLVAPGAMLDYVAQLCETEGVKVEPGVLPLVVRAGGGSPRDTLSLLDQLIAGSDATDGEVLVRNERAVALLGYTPGELLDAVIEAFAGQDAAAAFSAVDRVVQTGQDPRRFVDDLLERLRDLIVIAATGAGAAGVLRGVPADELERMTRQAAAFGSERLSRTADLVIGTLDEMTGATSPRLQLELMVARVLAHGGAGVGGAPVVAAAPTAAAQPPVIERARNERDETQQTVPPVVERARNERDETQQAVPPVVERARNERDETQQADVESSPRFDSLRSLNDPQGSEPQPAEVAPAEPASQEAAPAAPAAPAGPLTLDAIRAAWPDVLSRLERISRSSWLVVSEAAVADVGEGDVLTLAFRNPSDLNRFKQRPADGGPSEALRAAIRGVLGVTVKYLARLDDEPSGGGSGGSSAPQASGGPAGSAPAGDGGRSASSRPAGAESGAVRAPGRSAAPERASASTDRLASAHRAESGGRPASASAAAAVTEWAVAPIPSSGESAPASSPLAVDDEPEEATARTATATLPREGDVLPAGDIVPSMEEPPEYDDEDAPPPPPDDYVPPTVAPRLAPTITSRDDGVQRYGEAVVRQVLGATFVREEPYESPTRFS